MATGGHMVMIDGNQHICIIAHGHWWSYGNQHICICLMVIVMIDGNQPICIIVIMATGGGHMVMIDGNQHICIIAHGHWWSYGYD